MPTRLLTCLACDGDVRLVMEKDSECTRCGDRTIGMKLTGHGNDFGAAPGGGVGDGGGSGWRVHWMHMRPTMDM
jgi:hypothetical protein